MLLTEIDHIGIAVNDLTEAAKWYENTFGAQVVHREVIERDGVEEAMIGVAGSFVQLLHPTRADSPVAKFMEKRGEGIHHVAYRVENCELALDELRSEGVTLIDEVPRDGSRGTRIAFVRPHYGHLIELVEVP